MGIMEKTDKIKEEVAKPEQKTTDVEAFTNTITQTTRQETVTQLSPAITENPDLKPKQKDRDTKCLEEHAPAIFAAFKSGDRNALVSALGQRLNELAAPMSQQSQDAILATFDNQRQRDAVIKAVEIAGAQKAEQLGVKRKNMPYALDYYEQNKVALQKAGYTKTKFLNGLQQKGQKSDPQWTQKHGAHLLSVARSKGFMRNDAIERLRKQWRVSQQAMRDAQRRLSQQQATQQTQQMNQILNNVIMPVIMSMVQASQTMTGRQRNTALKNLRDELDDKLNQLGIKDFERRTKAVVAAAEKAEKGDKDGAKAIIEKVLKNQAKMTPQTGRMPVQTGPNANQTRMPTQTAPNSNQTRMPLSSMRMHKVTDQHGTAEVAPRTTQASEKIKKLANQGLSAIATRASRAAASAGNKIKDPKQRQAWDKSQTKRLLDEAAKKKKRAISAKVGSKQDM